MGGLVSDVGGAEAVSALEWWLEAGVDTLIAEDPRDWLRGDAAGSGPASAGDQPGTIDAPAPGMPDSLPLFRDWLAAGSSEPSASPRSKLVLPTGEEAAELMLVAEAPGREEAAAGTPIAGEAWLLTERMLAAIGISPDRAYLANLSCLYLPGVNPSAKDIERCGEIARRHVALAKPKRLLLFGDASARALLGKSLADARGHVHHVEGVRTIVTLHPRILLDRPSEKARAWKDLLLLMEDEA